MPSVAVMIRDAAGRLLLARDRDTGLWQTVGGAMEPGEEPAQAAVREALEETPPCALRHKPDEGGAARCSEDRFPAKLALRALPGRVGDGPIELLQGLAKRRRDSRPAERLVHLSKR